MRHGALEKVSKDIPLIVDLDGTLIRSDTLHEGLLATLFRKPGAFIKIIPALLKGKAFFKKIVSDYTPLDASALCYRAPLLTIIEQEKLRGREIHLVTAAQQSIADSVSNHLGVFDSATGSNEQHNLKGSAKLKWIQSEFPNGFIYAGDHKADLPIWKESRRAILVGKGASFYEKLKQMGIETQLVDKYQRPRLKDWLAELRIHQWSKNALMFVPLMLAHLATNVDELTKTIIAFCAFGLIASGTYIINDLADLEADRKHATKRLRPLAAGKISVASGVAVALLLMLTGGATLSYLSPKVLGVAGVYLFITLAYSFHLKRIPMLDVAIIGALFTLRIILGTVLLDLPLSPWLCSFSALFFFSLALAKRHVEIMRNRGSLKKLSGRGYTPDDWPLTLGFGIASAMSSIVIMLLFVTQEDMISRAYNHPHWLLIEPICVFLWILRIWLLSNQKQLDDDPVLFAVKDRTSQALGLVALTGFIMAS